MKLLYRGILAILGLLAAVLLLPTASPHAQTSSYSGRATPSYSYGSPTPPPGGSSGSNYNSSLSYFQTGAESYFSYSGGLKFKVPLSLTGHAFALKYVLNGAPGTINASVSGIVTEIVTPGSSAQTPLYVLVAASQPPPVGASDWYLADRRVSHPCSIWRWI